MQRDNGELYSVDEIELICQRGKGYRPERASLIAKVTREVLFSIDKEGIGQALEIGWLSGERHYTDFELMHVLYRYIANTKPELLLKKLRSLLPSQSQSSLEAQREPGILEFTDQDAEFLRTMKISAE